MNIFHCFFHKHTHRYKEEMFLFLRQVWTLHTTAFKQNCHTNIFHEFAKIHVNRYTFLMLRSTLSFPLFPCLHPLLTSTSPCVHRSSPDLLLSFHPPDALRLSHCCLSPDLHPPSRPLLLLIYPTVIIPVYLTGWELLCFPASEIWTLICACLSPYPPHGQEMNEAAT